MKKLVSVLLALATILAICTTVYADNATLTITGSDGRTYEGFQLLTLTTGLKDGEHPEDCDGTNHVDGCYNYAYSVNEKYREILQKEVFENAEDDFWAGSEIPADASKVTDTAILDYLSVQTGDVDGVYYTMREVADRLYRAILEKGIDADEDSLTGNNDEIAQGYWMFADVTDLDGENKANSLVMVDTMGQESITINPKTALPTVEKKVKDLDGTDADITDNAWQDSADHKIGATVPFKLTATLPSNIANYETYTIVFHDELSAGLTLNANSIKVYMYESAADAAADVALANPAADVTDEFTAVTDATGDNCTFEVGCDDILAIDGVDKDTVFVVYYEATLNEGAVLGAIGNPNEVYLEFSNDPYSDGTGETEKDKVIVFTYKLVVNKTDDQGNALEGAGFELYKKNADGEYVIIGTELIGDAMTTFEWTGLDDGDYMLKESTVPAGYNGLADIYFTITAEHDVLADDPALTALNGGAMGEGDLADGKLTGVIEKDIENNTGIVLPETGAKGTMLLIGGGAVLVILAAVFMITRKKMSVYAD